MISYTGNKAVVALFVKDLLQNLSHGCAWIMNIQSEAKSEDCCVSIVIDSWSESIVRAVAANYSGALTNIYRENTLGG